MTRAPQQDVFKIDGELFAFDAEACHLEVSSLSNDLSVKVVASTRNVQQGQREKLLNDYDDGQVAFQFSARGVYQQGVPRGRFELTEEKTGAPLYRHLFKHGFEYGLYFSGDILFEADRVEIRGVLKPSFEEAPVFDVEIRKHFDLSALVWRNYQFQSLEEAQSAPPSEVRFLSIENPEFVVLPARVLTFHNLETLTVYHKAPFLTEHKFPLSHLSEVLGDLQALTHLSISGAVLEHLPESLGKLKHLTHLSINRCYLTELPESL